MKNKIFKEGRKKGQITGKYLISIFGKEIDNELLRCLNTISHDYGAWRGDRLLKQEDGVSG